MVASWWPCCCAPTACVECSACAGTGNNAPRVYYATVSAVAGNSNTINCSTYNGTYLLTNPNTGTCGWGYQEYGTFHGYDVLFPGFYNYANEIILNLLITKPASNYFLTFSFRVRGGLGLDATHVFQEDLGTTAPDCTEFLDQPISFSFEPLSPYVCNFSGATVTITSDPDAGC